MVDWAITFLISFLCFENGEIWVGRKTVNEEKKAGDGLTWKNVLLFC